MTSLYQRMLTNMVRAWGLEPQRITAREPKSRMSTNSIMPADISGRDACRYFVSLCFYTARNRGSANYLTRVYKNRTDLPLPKNDRRE